MYCFKCGTEIRDDSKFCTECGESQKKIKSEESNESKLQEPTKDLKGSVVSNYKHKPKYEHGHVPAHESGQQRTKVKASSLEWNKSNESEQKTDQVAPENSRDNSPLYLGITLILGWVLAITFIYTEDRRGLFIIGSIFIKIFVTMWMVNIAQSLNRSQMGWGIFGFLSPPLALIIISFQDKLTTK